MDWELEDLLLLLVAVVCKEKVDGMGQFGAIFLSYLHFSFLFLSSGLFRSFDLETNLPDLRVPFRILFIFLDLFSIFFQFCLDSNFGSVRGYGKRHH